MPRQDDGSVNGGEEVGQGLAVVGNAAQRVGWGVDGVSVVLEALDDTAPAGGVREGACSSTIVGLVRPVLETAPARVSWPVAGAFDAALGMVAAAL
jgi:hypothetical protein